MQLKTRKCLKIKEWLSGLQMQRDTIFSRVYEQQLQSDLQTISLLIH
jgi:hypothetical protein